MWASIVIPLWNGASVITSCLEAVYANSGDRLLEVICVDNASQDNSADLVAEHFPQVRLIPQPINMGFAGGVNIGIEAAQGDLFVLLNQDCIVQPGWLDALVQAFEEYPEFGIAGCLIFNPDGTLNHAGAMISYPDAYGVHLTEIRDSKPWEAEYVTGASFALRRQTWLAVGRFDEGYYPAYYEESDYCYRARQKGFKIACVPGAYVVHLFSSREWQKDPIKHAANQHLSRYRFVCKHFRDHELREFFEVEYAAVESERYFEQAIGRTLAARETLRKLADIIERRRTELGEDVTPLRWRLLQVGFTQISQRSFAVAENLEPPHSYSVSMDFSEEWGNITQRLKSLQQQEHDLLARIYFKHPSSVGPEPYLKRLFRLYMLRPLSFLVGRDYLLLSQLNTVHVARLDAMEQAIQYIDRVQWAQRKQIERSLILFKILTEYEYR
jgi:GT2 family glycosyltransferase